MLLAEPRPRRKSPIRMTPLIDVVFILLVFFMVTSRLTQTGEVSLPLASGGSDAANHYVSLHLSIDGDPTLNGQPVSEDTLRARLASNPPAHVKLSTDGDLALTRFTQWLGYLESRDIQVDWQKNRSCREGDC